MVVKRNNRPEQINLDKNKCTLPHYIYTRQSTLALGYGDLVFVPL